MSRILRSGLVALALLLSLLVVPAVARAAPIPPPTLTGEALAGSSVGNSQNAFSCSTVGQGGTFSFAVTGVATGPYPGTFTETGSGTIAPNGTFTAFTATFTITSTVGTVTGTLTLAGGSGSCQTPDAVTSILQAHPHTIYQATITTPQGSVYTDTGTTTSALSVLSNPLAVTETFSQTFAANNTTTTPVAPTSKDQCKNGGYDQFTDPATGQPFKNQGQCNQFVNTGK